MDAQSLLRREVEGAASPFPARNNMKTTFFSAAVIAAMAFGSASMAAMTYRDSSGDLFDNGMSNLDITSVNVWNDENATYLSVTTASFASWTKYCIFVGDDMSTSTSNPWGRPHDQNGNATSIFIGSWVDQSSGNGQRWVYSNNQWVQGGGGDNSVNGNTVTWVLGNWGSANAAGYTFHFDVGTTGGGNDPFIDLLSRLDQSTSGWGAGSVAGTFASYTVTPAPGAVALLGLAGLISRRRRP